MRSVSLNPEKHSVANGYDHCEQVRDRAIDLASHNECTPEQIELLANLARVHDIGKITGTANPSKSVELLPKYGIMDEHLLQLMKYHDTNLSWYISAQKGQPPSSAGPRPHWAPNLKELRHGPFAVLCSAGFEDRAGPLADVCASALDFLSETFGFQPQATLKLLAEDDWCEHVSRIGHL